jgi:hypothetical protein
MGMHTVSPINQHCEPLDERLESRLSM